MDTLTGVGVIDKVVTILDALSDGPLGLTDLANRTAIKKPTVHRLCRALAMHGVLVQVGDLWELGSRLGGWAGLESDLDRLLAAAAVPLRRLRDETGESVQLFVVDGDQRRCVAGLESTHGLRTIVEVGALLPLNVGSAGAVLRNEPVNKAGWIESVEEREKGVASVSAPVRSTGEVVAAVSVSGPVDRMTRSPGRKFGASTVATARHLHADETKIPRSLYD